MSPSRARLWEAGMTVTRVALVTGSSSGIGAATARRLSATGFSVVVNSARSVAAGEELAAEIGGLYVQADIAVEQQARDLVQAAADWHGRLDVLVNNAGTTRLIPHTDFDAVTPQVWEEILGVNVVGTWQTTVAALPHLRAGGAGCVVNISSLAGMRPSGSSIPYAVSKAAVNHMTRFLASVVGPEVRVNAVAPGLVDTPWIAEYREEFGSHVTATAPLGRVGTPEDVAEAVLGLVNATYATGDVVVVDGGMHLR